jgi:hypothetical protein
MSHSYTSANPATNPPAIAPIILGSIPCIAPLLCCGDVDVVELDALVLGVVDDEEEEEEEDAVVLVLDEGDDVVVMDSVGEEDGPV